MDEILTDDEVKRLNTQGKKSYQIMARSRENRIKIIKDFVGDMYSVEGAALPQPVNIMKQALTTFARQCSPKNVRCLVGTEIPANKLAAEDLSIELAKVCKDINFDEATYLCVLDALISIGIMKVGVGQGEEKGEEGENYGSGKIFLDPVDLDDFFYDVKATSFQSASFLGNVYSIPLEDVRNDESYNQDIIATLQPNPRTSINYDGGEKASVISTGQEASAESFVEYVEFWDYWVPRKNALVTLTKDGRKVKEIYWEGPKRGPYRFLSMGSVPSNAMPTTMAQDLFAINEAQNCMTRKVICDELARKLITAVRKGADGDGSAITNSANHDALGLNDPKNVQELRFGGSDSAAVGILIQLQNKAKEVAGNLDSVAGLNPQSPTNGQDQLIAKNAGKAVEDISERVFKFCSLLLEDIAFWQFTDPEVKMSLEKSVGATGITIPFQVTPASRRGKFSDYNFQIDPYSLQPQTPEIKQAALLGWVNNYALPLMPILQSQGIMIDGKTILQLGAKYANISNEVSEIMRVAPPMPVPEQGMPQDQGMPANTTRTNVRVNKSGGGAGKDKELAAQMVMHGSEKDNKNK